MRVVAPSDAPAARSDDCPAGIMQIVAPATARTTMFPWQDADGGARLTIVVKWTYRVADDGLTVDPEPMPVLLGDEHRGDDPLAAPRLESDCAPWKPRADVVVVGRAHAPGGHPTERLVVGFRVGTLRRSLLVQGDRHWRARSLGRPAIEPPRPFTTMELGWERAFGGSTASTTSEANPVGRGLVAGKDDVDGTALPNVEDPHAPVATWTDRPAPAGFGFVARSWAPRRSLAGVSAAFHNGAPVEQQVEGYLRGDEEVELVHLTPGAHAAFRLPGLKLRITVTRWTEAPLPWLAAHAGTDDAPPLVDEPVRPVLDTLILLPEERRICLVYRAVCHLASADSLEIARVTVSA